MAIHAVYMLWLPLFYSMLNCAARSKFECPIFWQGAEAADICTVSPCAALCCIVLPDLGLRWISVLYLGSRNFIVEHRVLRLLPSMVTRTKRSVRGPQMRTRRGRRTCWWPQMWRQRCAIFVPSLCDVPSCAVRHLDVCESLHIRSGLFMT